MSKIKLINRKTKKEYWVTQADLDQMKEKGLLSRFIVDKDAKPLSKERFKPLELKQLRPSAENGVSEVKKHETNTGSDTLNEEKA